MQAIHTRFLPPTNFRGERIVAQCQAMRLVVSYPYELNQDDAHRNAAKQLCQAMHKKCAELYGEKPENSPWLRPFVTGQIADGSYVHVFKD